MKIIRSWFYSVSLALLLFVQITPAQARIQTNHQLNSNASTGKWGTELATATGVGNTSSYQITWTGNSNKQYELISFINSGSFDLLSEHLTFTGAKANGDTTNPPTLTFETCSGSWDSATFLCSGTISVVGSATSGTITFNKLITPSNRLIFRVTNARNNSGNYLSTFNSQAFRSDFRVGLSFSS